MAQWPEKFCPLSGTYRESPANNLIRSSMDIGPAKVRRRTTANTKPVSFNIFVKNENMAEFETFFNDTLASGALEFDFKHPRTEQNVKARFMDIPNYSDRSGVGYNISIALEIMP